MPRILVGLGNPGARYENTRHNIGFVVADRVARSFEIDWSRDGDMDIAATPDGAVVVVKPLTFMNRSGSAVIDIVDRTDAADEDVLVVVDDLDLDLGQLRLRAAGSSGGHNGLKSIIAMLATEGFPRLRLGIGAAPGGADTRDWVLDAFAESEAPLVERVIERATTASVQWLRGESTEHVMSRFNGRVSNPDDTDDCRDDDTDEGPEK